MDSPAQALARLLASTQQGRHRYHRLAGRHVAAMMESIMTVAAVAPRVASHDRLAAKSRLVGSRSRPVSRQSRLRSANLDRSTPGRQSSSKRSWLELTKPI